MLHLFENVQSLVIYNLELIQMSKVVSRGCTYCGLCFHEELIQGSSLHCVCVGYKFKSGLHVVFFDKF